MKTIYAQTDPFIKKEVAELNADVSAGASVILTLLNNDGFADNDFVVIESEGNEISEMTQINAVVVAGTDIQVDTLKFAHKKGVKIVKYRYNQRKYYGCATEDGTFVDLSATKDIQVDDPLGTLYEYTGSDYLYFKATYYNSEESLETDIDDAVAKYIDDSKNYCSIVSIKNHLGFIDNPYYSNERIIKKREQAESEINSVLFLHYTLPLSEIPALIENIAILLAAGYIDYEEFGVDGEGKKWLGEGRALLNSISNGKQRLLDSDFEELEKPTDAGAMSGYPDSDGVDDEDLAETKFKIDDKY